MHYLSVPMEALLKHSKDDLNFDIRIFIGTFTPKTGIEQNYKQEKSAFTMKA